MAKSCEICNIFNVNCLGHKNITINDKEKLLSYLDELNKENQKLYETYNKGFNEGIDKAIKEFEKMGEKDVFNITVLNLPNIKAVLENLKRRG